MSEGLNVFYVTQDGLNKISEELVHLKNDKRVELADKLEAAIKQGDLKENADYHAAKEEQAFVEGRIRDLEDKLRRAKVIKDPVSNDSVRVGSTVTVLDEEYDEEETFHIVGPLEADPANGRISNESPYGQALLGARLGQIVQVKTPGGIVQLKVQQIG